MKLFNTRPQTRLAAVLVTACEVSHRGPGNATSAGSQYSQRTLLAAVSSPWPRRAAPGIAACLATAPLTPPLADNLAAKVCAVLRRAHTQDWPALANTAWTAAVLGGSDVGATLNRVVAALEAVSAGVLDTQVQSPPQQEHAHALRNAEGMVLITLERAANTPRLGAAFARACSPGSHLLCPPGLAPLDMPGPLRCGVLLALALATHVLQSAALGALHDAVVRSFGQNTTAMMPKAGAGGSIALTGGAPSPWLATAAAAAPGAKQAGAHAHPLLEVVRRSTCGWEPLVPALVALGQRMMEAAPAAGAVDPAVDVLAAVAEMDVKQGAQQQGTAAPVRSAFSPYARAAALGYHLLASVFKHHDGARLTIVRACAAQLMGASASQRRMSACAALHARLLLFLCRAFPSEVAPHAECLRDAFHHAACLSQEATTALLLCCRPLAPHAPQLHDHCALALRKALFDTNPGRAAPAAGGVLHQALQALQAPNAADTISPPPPGGGPSQERNASLPGALYLGSFLRRCLTQDAGVRRIAYHGLTGLAKADPHGPGAATAASALLSQLHRYASPTIAQGAAGEEVGADEAMHGGAGGGPSTARPRDDDDDDDADGIKPAFQLAACVTQAAQWGGSEHAAAVQPVEVEPFGCLLRACCDVIAAVTSAGEGAHAAHGSVVDQLQCATKNVMFALLNHCEDSTEWEEAYGIRTVAGGGLYDSTSAARARVLCAALQVAVDWAMHELLSGRRKLVSDWRKALTSTMACHTRLRMHLAASARSASKKAAAPAVDGDAGGGCDEDGTTTQAGGPEGGPAAATGARAAGGASVKAVSKANGGGDGGDGLLMRSTSLVALLGAMADPNDLAGVLPPAGRDKGMPTGQSAVVNVPPSAQFVIHVASSALDAAGHATWLLALAAGHSGDEATVRALAPPSVAQVNPAAGARGDGRSVAAALMRVAAQMVRAASNGSAPAAGDNAAGGPGGGKGKGGKGGAGGGPGRQPVLLDPPMRVALIALEAYLRRCAGRGDAHGVCEAATALADAFGTQKGRVVDDDSDDDDDIPLADTRQNQNQQQQQQQQRGRAGAAAAAAATAAPQMSRVAIAAGLKAGLAKLQQLIGICVPVKAMVKDTTLLLSCMSHVMAMWARVQEEPYEDAASWAMGLLCSQSAIAGPPCAQLLTWVAVQARAPRADVQAALQLCKQMQTLHGRNEEGAPADEDMDEPGDARDWAPLRQLDTVGAVAAGVLRWVDATLGDVDQLLGMLRAHAQAVEQLMASPNGGSGDGPDASDDDPGSPDGKSRPAVAHAALEQRRGLEAQVCSRLEDLVTVTASMVGTKLPLQFCGDATAKCTTRLVKTISALVVLSTPTGGKRARTAAGKKDGGVASTPAAAGQSTPAMAELPLGVVGLPCVKLIQTVDKCLVDAAYGFVQRVEDVRPTKPTKGKKRKGKGKAKGGKKKKVAGDADDSEDGDDDEEASASDEDEEDVPAGGAPGHASQCSAATLRRIVKQLPGMVFALQAMQRSVVAMDKAHGSHTGLLKYAKLHPKRDFRYTVQ